MMKIQHSVLGMCATNTYYVYDDETKRGLIVDPADSPDTIIAKADSLSMIPEAILISKTVKNLKQQDIISRQ